jgi:hypothetical protein
MIVKAKFIEMIWDNYQGASGKPIVRSLLIDLPNEIRLDEIEEEVLLILFARGIKGTYNSSEKSFPCDGLLNIQILPLSKNYSHDQDR